MKNQVVFIMVDTQSYDMLGCNNNRNMHTPNLDRLSNEGLTFDCAYTCQPVCGPARSAIFTGLYPHSNGAFANCIAPSLNVKTIGQRLSDNGVPAAYIGKWHLDGGDYFGTGICPDGWDKEYWYDMRCYLEELTEQERIKSRDPKTISTEGINETFTYAHRCSNKAIQYIDKHCDDNFLLVLSYDEPHDPHLCPEPYASMYNNYKEEKKPNVYDMLDNKPEHQRVWADERLNENKDEVDVTPRMLYSCNSYADYEIGRVLDKIKEKIPNAMIIYTSDHGDMRNSHCLYGKGPAPYDEITKIPLIIKNSETIAGTRYSHPVSHIDLVPTILDYMGENMPKWLEGKSLRNAIKNQEQRINDAIFIEFGRYETDHDGFGGFQPMRCVFDGRYKLCINLLSSDELYDLKSDKYENINLINDEATAKIRDSLHDMLLNWMNTTRDPFRGYYWEARPWRADAQKPTWKYTGYTRQRENDENESRQLDYATGLEMVEATRKKQ